MAHISKAETTETEAATSPLRTPVFRALWIATIASNVGTWMHDVGAGWMMTSLAPNPFMVALVQAATTLPMFLFALPAGALADIMDRRRMLIGAQFVGLCAAAFLSASTALGLTTPAVLLLSTFVLGLAAASSAPVFQAIVPELVARPALPDAVALNSLGVNISRAIGPAVGGFIVAFAGTAAVFALNAVSFVGILLVLFRWRRETTVEPLPAERFVGAMRAGLRYARHSPPLRLVLVRSVGFFVFGSALWAMLPLVARRELGLGASGYGVLLASMGAGAVLGAFLLKILRQRFVPNAISVGATILFALVMGSLAFAPNAWLAAVVMVGAGLGWIGMLTSLNVAAQMASPAWVKARALALYLVVFQGSMASGSVLWGAAAVQIGVPWTLLVAALGQAAALTLAFRWRLPKEDASDLARSLHWAEPMASVPPEDDRGPIAVEIEYRVAPGDRAEFLRRLHDFKRVRRRDGAIRWDVWQDMEAPDRLVETFVVESWAEHQRQHRRVTRGDRREQEALNALHSGAQPPRVRHLRAR